MSKNTRIHTYEDAGDLLFKEPMLHARKLRERRTLHVTWDEKSCTLKFSVIMKNNDVQPGGESTISNREDIIECHLKQLAFFIKETSRIVAHGQSAKKTII